ncbi:MAG: M15 family metallopeptidase, partial [Gemmatimonadaceae bacterium]
MTIAAAVGLQFPTAPVVRTTNTRDADNTAPKSPADPAQFAALMALLANNNPQLRTSLMKQVPANGVGLLDQLLSGAQTGELNGTLASALTGALSGPQTKPQIGNDTNSALDAARYGLLAESGLSITTTKNPEGGNQNRISNAVLSRIAARKSPSVDELLALGDRDGALARAKLDALLATAGTTEGAKLAAANALAAQLLQSANNPAAPITNTDGLDPEFKSRLDRVVSRMKNETGLDVTLVETVRSQDRQNALYALGRTTPGDVVTWTQDSMHSRGQAADLMVGGSFDNPQGFAQLQKIALEEGLHTLGPSDPGHLEMPRNSQATDAAARALTAANARVVNTSNNGVARVAQVTQVATIGNNARVASDSSSNSTRAPAALNSATTAAPTWNGGNSPKSTSSDSQSSDNAGERPATTTRNSKSAVTENNNAAALGDLSRNNEPRFIGPKETIDASPAQHVDGAQRVQDIDTLRDQSATKSLSQLTLEIDGANG